MTDPISDMLTRIRNAVTAKHTRVDMPASKLKAEIARILLDEGYIQGFRTLEEPAEKVGRHPAGSILESYLYRFFAYFVCFIQINR
jgi:ribosomal protein S8